MNDLLLATRSKSAVAVFMFGMMASFEALACYPPEVPSCFSSQGLVSGQPDFHFCRAQIERYQNDADQYIRCLENKVNDAGQALNHAARDFEWKRNEYKQAANQLNRSAEQYNQANTNYQQIRAVYERDLAAVRQTMDAIVRNFNAMFGQ